jgi:hypothetical protein
MIFIKKEDLTPVTIPEQGVMYGISFASALLGPVFEHQLWYCFHCGIVRAVCQLTRGKILLEKGEKPEPETGRFSAKQLRSVPDEDLLPKGWELAPIKDSHEDEEVRAYGLLCDECAKLNSVDL